MIEEALRKMLKPTVNRRRRLHLTCMLGVYWSVMGLLGVALLGADWLWGWRPSAAVWGLCIATAFVTIMALYKYSRSRPDYRAIAHNIENRHPDVKALLLTAIEQQPRDSDGQLGYLQERVIGEALRHATDHNWLESVSWTKLVPANVGAMAAFLLLAAALSQMLPLAPSLFKADGLLQARPGYHITVSPGDANVESGTPVVILARFDGHMPAEANLLIGAPGQDRREIALAKNLEDPVFGSIIEEVKGDLLYHIEYAGKRTGDYKLSTYEHPLLHNADAKIIYPSYTKLPEKVIKDTRQVNVVEGSEVTLTFTLNKPVAAAQLVAKDQSTLDLSVTDEQPNVYTTSITAVQNVRYELRLADAEGRANKMPPRFVIDVHKNLPPELKPLFPNRDVQASSLEELSLEAEVSDDFGVTAYGLSYTLAGEQSKDVELGQSPESKDKQPIRHVLALEELDAQPDELLTYYFWADDVGPDGRPRRTSSDMYFAEVRHFEEIFRESQSSQSRQNQNQQQGQQQQGGPADQLARLQKQIISATWNIKRRAAQTGDADDQKEDVDVVRQSQADALQQAQSALAEAEDPTAGKTLQAATEHMEKSLEHLRQAVDPNSTIKLGPALAAEQSAYQELLKLKRREHQVGRSQGSGRSSNSGASARSEQQLEQLELKQEQDRYETERLAQSQEQATQREDLQVLSRLRELARRQNEMSNKLKELEAALRQAQTEEQEQEIRRELKRLREEQLEAIRDVDELQQRMERPENRQRMADAREQLSDTRSRVRQAATELQDGMVSRAITSTTRAGRQLEQMRDEFRRMTSGQFSEEMRDMRDRAQKLDQRQKEIAEEMKQQAESERKTLTDSGTNAELADRMEEQKARIEELTDQMKDVSEEAESSEPLLSKKLYDALRETSTDNVDRALDLAGELLRRNFLPQAQEIEKQAGKGIEELKKGVEAAADSVLGDEAESLRLARRQLDELIRQVDDEIAGAGVRSGRRPGDPNDPAGSTGNQQRLADARSESRGQEQNQQSTTPQEGRADTDSSQNANATTQPGRTSGRTPGSPADGTRRPDGRTAGTNASGRENPAGWGGDTTRGPLTGEDFRQWSDRLGDVEEMLNAPNLRNEAARVRDRARAMRAEFKRHGKEPQWDLVRQQIMKPLSQLRKRLSDELAQLESDEAMVPIDRDPVPGRFAELVRRYYENLGGDN